MGLRRHFAALSIIFLTLNVYLTDACRGHGAHRRPPPPKPIPRCNSIPWTNNCPYHITKFADPRSTSAVASWPEPQPSSHCPPVSVWRTTGLPNGGRFYASGSPHYIAYAASDRNGNTNNGFCKFSITVTVRRCGILPPVPSGLTSCTNVDQYGSECTINCISGYSRSGSPRRTCQIDSRWSGTMPRCTPIRCSPELTTVTCTNGNYYGSICTRTCNPGYAIASGHSSSRVCQADGKWTGTPATCEDIQGPTLECPDTIRDYADPSTTTKTASWEPPRVLDNSKLSIQAVQTMGLSSGSSFGRGSHNIRYEATDKAGNTGSCSFSVVIQVIQCPSLAVLTGQTRTCSARFNYGSVCQIQCFPGYALSSNVSSIECQRQNDSAIGTWSAAQPTCDEVTCPALTPPANGQFYGGTPCLTAYGAWCRFECNQGFQLTGSAVRRCLALPGASQGIWDGPVADCEVQTCPRAYVPTYGRITNSAECPASDHVPAQTTCTYNCKQGHVLTGEMNVTCGSDGDWTPFPYCKAVTCDNSELPAPANGLKNGCPPSHAEEIFGTTCILLCNRGYMPTQPTSVTCTDNGNGVGVWNGNTITCEEVKCDPLDVPTGPGYTAVTCTLNGASTDPVQMQNYDAVCVSSCNQGFTASGLGSRVCLQTGQWNGTPLLCRDITPPTLTCPTDITLFAGQGTSFAVDDYTWEPIEALDASGNIIASLISINGQPVPANRSTMFYEGTYRLDYSAADHDGNSAMCDVLVNVIVARCPPLYGPQNSETSLVSGQGSCDMSAVFGSVCSVTCEDGYALSTGGDSVNATCIRDSSLSTTGNWQVPSVECEPNTCRVPPIVNGYISGCVGLDVDYQSSCSFICNTGHRSNQTSLSRTIRTCRADGTWTGQDTFCEPVVCTGLLSLNQGTVQPPQCLNATQLPYGTRCTFTCNDGFARNGPFSRVCTAEGVWNDVRTVSCTDHQPPVFTESCPMYHTQIAVPNMRQAVVTFPTPQATDNSNSVSITSRDPNLVSGSSFPDGRTRLIYTATDSAMNRRRCDVYITVEVLRCRSLQAPASGSLVDCAINILGSTCRFACNTGYNLMGPSNRTCQRVVNSNGFENKQVEWSGEIPSCSPVTCPALNNSHSDSNAIRSGCAHPPATEPLGTTCSWYCPYGYGGTGTPRSVCLADGTWDPVDFTCEKRRCPVLIETTGMNISPNDCLTAPTYNLVCSLGCSRSGYRVNPPSYDSIRCLASGDWTRSSTAFTCVDYEEPHFTSCPLRFTEYTTPGTTYATVTWVVTADDNSGETPLISCSIQQPAVLAVGEHSVSCTATDGAGNRASCNFDVQVKVRRCRSLNPPIYGTFVGSCDNCQDCTCQVGCVNGYTLQGASTATCTRNNSTGMMYWSRNGQHPTCQITRCEPLPAGLIPSNGGVYPSFCRGPMYPYFGSTCHFFCQTGYRLTGNVDYYVLTCLPDGTWNQNLFTVAVRCQDNVPPTIQPCPMSLSGSMSGQTLGVILSFDVPRATDNSGVDSTVIKTPLDIDSPYNFTRDTDVSYLFVDPSGNRAYCNFSVYIQDNRSPVLVSCPSDIYKNTSLKETAVSWKMPEFMASNGSKLDGICNMPNGSLFRLGSANVQCCATIICKTVCRFTVTLTPNPCPELMAPRDGAKACEDWAYGSFCYMYCDENHDIPRRFHDRRQLRCTNIGTWSPSKSFPDCSETKRAGRMALPSALHYFSGNCNSPATQQQIKENFLQALDMNVQFRHICIEAGSRCNVGNVAVTCGSSTRRKRSSVIDKWTDSQQDHILSDGFVPWSNDSAHGDELTKRAQKWLTEMRANGKLPPDPKDEYLRRRRLHSHQSLDPARERSHRRRKRDAVLRVTVSFIVTFEMPDTSAMTNTEYENAAWDCYDELDDVTAVVQDMASNGNLTLEVDGQQMQSDTFDFGNPEPVCPDGYEGTEITCVGCAPGLYFDTVSRICEECPIGHYQDEEAQLECKACPASTSTLQLGSHSITDCRGLCAIGQYSNTGLEPCSNCETETYQTFEGAQSCDPCPYGQSTVGFGASSVTSCIDVCHAGSFSAAGIQPCSPCPLHSYQPEEGQCSCYPCPAGQITQSIGSTDLSMCQTQTFCSATSCLNDGTCVEQLESYHCNCPLGLTGSRCETDVVDCQPESCLNGATCVEERNGFSCVCTTGYEGDDCSISIDYCVNDPCENGGTCRSQAGGFICECDTGFAGLTCTDDVNECIHNPCQNGASCLNREGDYQCVCIAGFTGDNCETHIDECQSNPCRHNGTCHDGDNSYNCICISGFSGDNCEVDDDLCASNPCAHGATCQDLDDHYQCACPHGWGGVHCESAMGPCDYQPCKNDGICRESTSEESGYVCACWPGFDGPDCEVNIDECAKEPCSNGGTCVDGVKNFVCTCADGFAGPLCEGRTDLCNPNPCQHDAPCEDEGDDYYCVCPAGVSGRLCETQVDVCREGETCQNGGVCAAPSMDQSCTCTDGFIGPLCDGRTDVCNPNPCQHATPCEDRSADWGCACPAGFIGEHCEINVDDCAVQPCANDALCMDGINNFTCLCLEGFTGALCDVELNECDAFPCHNGSCVDKINGYECECANGFEGPACENNKDDCFSGACVKGNCIDGVDSHHCQCDVGYTGRKCDININECQSNPCANGGACHDLVNGFVCDCADGWSGIQCDINIDDCASDPCLNSGQCIDGHLSYTCRCSDGFVGTFCEVNKNECEDNPCGNHGTCVDGVNGYTCSCSTGWKGDRCQINIGYCQPNPCKHGGSCTQTPQGFECQCPSGFEGIWCQTNIDDCVGNQCLNGATCVDQANRYSCRCPPGYTGPFCQTALDICTAEPCENDGVCLPSGNRAHHCTCLPGFIGVRCEVAIDNCQPNPCLHIGTCESNLNGYQCSCMSGFTGTECELNIDECMSQPCLNGAECMDGINEYQCKCKPGFIGLQCGEAGSTNFNFVFNGGQPNQFVALHDAVENPMQAFTVSFWIRTATPVGHIVSYSTHPNGFTFRTAEFALGKPRALEIFMKGFKFPTSINVNDNRWHHVAVTWSDLRGLLKIYQDGNLQSVFGNVYSRVDIGAGGVLRAGYLYSPTSSNQLTGALSSINLWDAVLHSSTIQKHAETCSSPSPGNVVAAADFLNTAILGRTTIQTPSACDMVDDCASDPCAAGSTCVDGIGQYRCQCPPGFSGQWCQINIDDCGTGSTPCDNGGTCVDGVDSFTCQCPEGFSGQACELRRVDGGWSDWSEWDDCSQSCMGGTQSRRRSCTNPRPAYGGSQCGGQPTESRPCNTGPCPYCRPIQDPENGYLDCRTKGTEYVCNIFCHSGYALSRSILPFYSCGPESNFRWSQEEDSSAAYIFPMCTAYKPPIKVAVEINLAYGSYLTCDGINATHDRQVYQKVNNMVASNLETVKCVQDNSCQKRYQVKGCSPQSIRRRRQSVESIKVTITLEHNVHIPNHPNLTNEDVMNQTTTTQAAAELRQGAVRLINQSAEGYFAVQIRNTMYDIDDNKTENFGVAICSPGTVRSEAASDDARCVPCEPGWYDSQDGCQPCPHGMYQPQQGSTFCLACLRGMTTFRIGTIQRSDCNRRDSPAAK